MKDLRVIPNEGFTHARRFHADDVFSAALLKLLNPDIKIHRGFVVPENFDGIVFDIGHGEFDHHQKNNECRTNEVPYASFGKLWRAFGDRLVSKELVEKIDKEFIQDLDKSDNTGSYNPIAEVISALNPSWRDPNPDYNTQFEKAVNLATEMLESIIQKENDIEFAQSIADKAIIDAKCKEIIILPQYAPVTDYLADKDAKFVIFPSDRGGYMVQVIPEEAGTQRAKIDLPKEWGGCREELSEINKIDDMIFCHNTLFCCSANTLEGAIKCAVVALNEEVEYNEKYDEGIKYIMSGIEKNIAR